MPRMEGPPVVRSDEPPLLLGQAHFLRAAFDVADRAPDVIRRVEKHLPPSLRPHRMIWRPLTRRAKCRATCVLEVADHFFRGVLVLAIRDVDVVGRSEEHTSELQSHSDLV